MGCTVSEKRGVKSPPIVTAAMSLTARAPPRPPNDTGEHRGAVRCSEHRTPQRYTGGSESKTEGSWPRANRWDKIECHEVCTVATSILLSKLRFILLPTGEHANRMCSCVVSPAGEPLKYLLGFVRLSACSTTANLLGIYHAHIADGLRGHEDGTVHSIIPSLVSIL